MVNHQEKEEMIITERLDGRGLGREKRKEELFLIRRQTKIEKGGQAPFLVAAGFSVGWGGGHHHALTHRLLSSKSLMRSNNPSCIFLCEMKGSRSQLEWACKRLGYHNAKIV